MHPVISRRWKRYFGPACEHLAPAVQRHHTGWLARHTRLRSSHFPLLECICAAQNCKAGVFRIIAGVLVLISLTATAHSTERFVGIGIVYGSRFTVPTAMLAFMV